MGKGALIGAEGVSDLSGQPHGASFSVRSEEHVSASCDGYGHNLGRHPRSRTEISETGFRVSRPRPRLASTQSQFRDRDRDFFLVVSTTRLRPRLFSQSLNFEIETETFFVKSQDRD